MGVHFKMGTYSPMLNDPATRQLAKLLNVELDMPRACHGYQTGCDCERCLERVLTFQRLREAGLIPGVVDEAERLAA